MYLDGGKSSRLHSKLVKEKGIFTSVNAHVTGTIDPGLLMIQGFLKDEVSPEDAEREVRTIIEELRTQMIEQSQFEKVVNQALSSLAFSRVEMLDKCMALAYSVILGNPEHANQESDRIASVSRQDILDAASRYLGEDNCTVMYYLKKNRVTKR